MCGGVVCDNVGSQVRAVGSADLARLGNDTVDPAYTQYSMICKNVGIKLSKPRKRIYIKPSKCQVPSFYGLEVKMF